MRKKVLSVVLSLSVVSAVLLGCGTQQKQVDSIVPTDNSIQETSNQNTGVETLPDQFFGNVINATPDMYANTDLRKPYTVNMYLIGDTPNDWQNVLDEINDYLTPFNTTLAVTFMSWSDYNTMYTLNLAGGADIDLIFTAPWCYMYSEAAKGSFLELTEEFRGKYMPLATKYQAPESWDETTLSGKTIAVPSNTAQPMGKIVAVRQDLMEKYDMKNLQNWEDYKQYMLTIAKEETPSSGIYGLAAAGDNNELWDVYRQQFDTMLALDSNYLDFIYEYQDGIPTKDAIKFVYEYAPFRQYAKDMKEMADAGCWSRSALTNTVTDDDAFGALQGASIAWNASVFTYMKQAEQTPGVVCNAYDLTKEHLVGAEAYSNNDMAITASSKNPERAAMVLDLIKFDTTLNRLLLLGQEGVHYTIEDGSSEYTKTDKSGDYAPMSVSVSWAIKNGNLSEAGAPEREKAIADTWMERVRSNPTITFVFDDTAVKTYVNAVGTVLQDYVPMLELGLVNDVDATLDEMMKKCDEAGLQNVYDEFYRQYEEWYATR